MIEWFKIALILFGVTFTTSDHSAQFLSTINNHFDQLVTSSTLKWISAENGKVPVNAIVGAIKHSNGKSSEEENVYICRAMHDAEWIPGSLVPEEKACYISLLGLVKSYKTYEVLQNVDNASRLAWTDWDTYHQYPSGIVAGGIDFYIARKKVGESEDNDVSSQVDGILKSAKGYSHYVGKFNSKESFGRMSILTEDKQERRFIKGQLLIETEPIRYELNNVRYTVFRRRVQKERKLLASTVLRNTEQIPLKVDSILAYDSVYSSYWGQGSAILKGLTTVIRNATTGNIIAEIEWGIEETEERKDVYKVEMTLQPGTAVNVTLWGNETKSELPYTGTLVSFYKGGATTARKIDGSRRLLQMLDVKPELGPVYFIRNNTLVPTTSTTTTTTTTTTTSTTLRTTTTTTTDVSNHLADFSSNKKNDALLPAHRDSQSNDMLSDEGALSLKKNVDGAGVLEVKTEGENSSPSQFILSPFAFLFSMLLTITRVQRLTCLKIIVKKRKHKMSLQSIRITACIVLMLAIVYRLATSWITKKRCQSSDNTNNKNSITFTALEKYEFRTTAAFEYKIWYLAM